VFCERTAAASATSGRNRHLLPFVFFFAAFFALTGTSGGTPGHPLSEIPKRAPVHPSHFRFLYLEFRKDAVPFRVIAALGA
jgi:hypothetical protein